MEFQTSQNRFRALASTLEGQALWECLTQRDNVVRLITASDLGHVAVEGVDIVLRCQLGYLFEGHDSDSFKQLAGMMTRQILSEQGYEIKTHRKTRTGV
ncbi:MAG: hypothetical protein ACYC64_13890, partial [Armatimonadota bacterium]